MILPSSGTIGNNGALSAITALPQTYSGGCYMYFPVNAIAAGVAAGLYYVVMSSTTAGTIYNNTYTIGNATIPTTLVPFVTTGSGAYTQSTAAQMLLTIPVPGGAMGVNGLLQIETLLSNIGNTNAKTMTMTFGGTNIQSVAQATAANVGSEWRTVVQNRGAQNVQVFGPPGNVGFGVTATPNSVAAIDTSATQNIVVSGTLAVATDWIILEGSAAWVFPQ